MEERYDYKKAVQEDVNEYLEDNVEYLIEQQGIENIEDYSNRIDEIEQNILETLICADSITGYGSGSYTFNTYEAEKYLAHNLDLLCEALEEDSWNTKDIIEFLKEPETCDSIIRCHILWEMTYRDSGYNLTYYITKYFEGGKEQ